MIRKELMRKVLEIVVMPTGIYNWQLTVNDVIIADSNTYFQSVRDTIQHAKPIINLIKKDKSWSIEEVNYYDQKWLNTKKKKKYIGGK